MTHRIDDPDIGHIWRQHVVELPWPRTTLSPKSFTAVEPAHFRPYCLRALRRNICCGAPLGCVSASGHPTKRVVHHSRCPRCRALCVCGFRSVMRSLGTWISLELVVGGPHPVGGLCGRTSFASERVDAIFRSTWVCAINTFTGHYWQTDHRPIGAHRTCPTYKYSHMP